jgi:hypothetical protein
MNKAPAPNIVAIIHTISLLISDFNLLSTRKVEVSVCDFSSTRKVSVSFLNN